MKYEIYKKKDPEKTVTLSLIKDGEDICLAVVNDEGRVIDRGYLLRLTSFGEILLQYDVANNLGFKLDVDGRIVVR